jgi:bifunctional non-homologous end joining protein LigD
VALDVYRKKRRFSVTPEPRGKKARGKGHGYVIQKHAATRLHYDLRLELDGVMKSWAVTRGPSLNPGDKRLAVQTEDHPIEYNKFEGTIPKGEYGGGTVMIWDRGAWEPLEDPHKGLKKGHLSFALEGEKLHGAWHLVRLRGRPGEKHTNWLLIKAHDEHERGNKDADILEEEPNSVVTGRSIDEIAAGKGRKRVWHSNRSTKNNVKSGAVAKGNSKATPRRARSPRRAAGTKKAKVKSKAKRASGGRPLPEFIPPSLATLRAQAPSGPGWVHEIKFDGYRIQARLDGGDVRLLTRKGLDWRDKFPNVAEAVAALPAETALIDGEIVVVNEHGVSDFSMLQAALSDGERERFRYYVFDLLHLDGEDLSSQPLLDRKAALKELLESADVPGQIQYSEHFAASGSEVWDQACQMNLEGILSKRADAPYHPGRSDSFLKIKCHTAQEFVVGGYSPSTAMPRAIGALVAGYYKDGRLVYAGRIGTGYTHAVARDLWKRLNPLELDKPPFDDMPKDIRRRRDVRWVKPEMVIESHFRGWTGDGLVRQAAFKGLREDKPAREVKRELPAVNGVSTSEPPRLAAAAAKASTKKSAKTSKKAAGRRSAGPASPRKSSRAHTEEEVRLTNPDRVYWKDAGVTKQDLAEYYRSVWDWMAPHVVGRPLSFLRCPEGTDGECFFQKHASAGLSEENLHTVIDAKKRQVIAIDDLEGLLSLVQAGVLEVHLRGSTIDRLDLCERIVFDIDPGPGIGWTDIVKTARDVRERLAAIDLESFVKTTGGKGLHVVLPIKGTDWEIVKTFVQAFAQAMAADEPERYVAKMTKSLRKGKIFIDYMRNSLEQTAVGAFSTRARAGAPVSVPVTWEELGRLKGANQYTVLNIAKRLGSLKRDPWADIGRMKQKLPDLRTLRRRR